MECYAASLCFCPDHLNSPAPSHHKGFFFLVEHYLYNARIFLQLKNEPPLVHCDRYKTTGDTPHPTRTRCRRRRPEELSSGGNPRRNVTFLRFQCRKNRTAVICVRPFSCCWHVVCTENKYSSKTQHAIPVWSVMAARW